MCLAETKLRSISKHNLVPISIIGYNLLAGAVSQVLFNRLVGEYKIVPRRMSLTTMMSVMRYEECSFVFCLARCLCGIR